MNDKLIERLALECADKWDLPGDSETIMDFAVAFLAAVDAERGKEAVAWRVETGYDQPRYLFHSTKKPWGKSEPLFLAPQPAIPEGMALVTKEDANNYCRILSVLGMEEEGDPISKIETLIAAAGVAP